MAWQYTRWVRTEVRGIKPADKALLYTIADATPHGQAGITLFQRDLSEQSGLPERSVRDGLARLRKAGLIETMGKGGHVRGRGIACTYRLILPPETGEEKPAHAAGLTFKSRWEPPLLPENRREPPPQPGGTRLQEPGETRLQERISNTPLEEKKGESARAIGAAFDAWNETAGRVGLPRAQVLTDKRKRAIAARLRDLGGVDGWRELLAKVEASAFLTGQVQGRGGGEPFRACLDWITNPNNLAKTMEGNYDTAGREGRIGKGDRVAGNERRRGDRGGTGFADHLARNRAAGR